MEIQETPKNSPHTPETLEKIKKTIEDLKNENKQNRKIYNNIKNNNVYNVIKSNYMIEDLNIKYGFNETEIKILKNNLKIDINNIKDIYLNIDHIDDLQEIINKLPLIDSLIIEGLEDLENITTIYQNLPITLKNIYITSFTYENQEENDNIYNDQLNKMFEIPFGCKIKIIKYNYKYSGNKKRIDLLKKKIKKKLFCIKKSIEDINLFYKMDKKDID